MVRTYKRKAEKGVGYRYSEEDLHQAIDDVKNGNKTIRGAAIMYSIPRTTLKHYINETRGKGKQGGGVKSYLTVEEETELAVCIKEMEKNGFGLSRQEVMDLVQRFIVQNQLQTRFKDGRPGQDWFTNFRIRHNLSLKKPRSIEYVRCDQANPWVVYDFFERLTGVIKELNLIGLPDQIYNCDETSFCHDPSKTKIVGAKGVSSERKTAGSGRENTTVLMCCSAAGKTLPLLCVFKGKYVMENWIGETDMTQTAVYASDRGWMETKLFFNWFKNVFLPNIGPQRPVLLIYDGHVTHISTKLIRLAQENQMVILKLPPHTTQLLQHLDVAVFRGMKSSWDKELCKWQLQNPRKKIPKAEFVRILSLVVKGMPKANIVSGFRATGIYDEEKRGPNKDRIPLTAFKPDDLRRYQATLPSQSSPEASTSKMASPLNEISNRQPIASVEEMTASTSQNVQQTQEDPQIVSEGCTSNMPSTSKSIERPEKRSFGDLLLEMFKKDASQPVEKKKEKTCHKL